MLSPPSPPSKSSKLGMVLRIPGAPFNSFYDTKTGQEKKEKLLPNVTINRCKNSK